MGNVNIKINGMPLSVPGDSTILEAARIAGIDIPTLCYLKGINEIGACRMCVVEVKGARSLVASCIYPVNEGMEVQTNTPKIQKSRKMTLEMLLSVHNQDCLACKRSGSCEFQTLCYEMGVEQTGRFEGKKPDSTKDESSLHLIRDNSKCILCRRCVAACADQHGHWPYHLRCVGKQNQPVKCASWLRGTVCGVLYCHGVRTLPAAFSACLRFVRIFSQPDVAGHVQPDGAKTSHGRNRYVWNARCVRRPWCFGRAVGCGADFRFVAEISCGHCGRAEKRT